MKQERRPSGGAPLFYHSGVLDPPSESLPDIGDDPRFHAAIAMLTAHDYFEASDEFEDLFFEAVRDEVEFARVFLQLAAGGVHLELRQWRAAAQRLDEAVRAIARVTNDRGFDLVRMASELRTLIAQVRQGSAFEWPRVLRR
jgi:predicted metal-dependent hydrolase